MHTLAEIRKGTVKKLNGIFVSLLLKIVVIDPHGDTDIFVSKKMLHRGWIHAGADALSRKSMPEKMRVTVLHTGWFCRIYDFPQSPKRRSGKRVTVLHMDDVRGHSIFSQQERPEPRCDRYVPVRRWRFQRGGDGSRTAVARKRKVVSDVDNVVSKSTSSHMSPSISPRRIPVDSAMRTKA